MKLKLFASLACLLLVAGPVGAEIKYVYPSERDPCVENNVTCMTWYAVTKEQYACLARMEEVLRQLELDITHWEAQRLTTPLWELNAMLQRRPMWTQSKRECWSKP